MSVPHKSEQVQSETPRIGLLQRYLGGSSDAADKARRDMDRRELARLRMAIARGSDHDRRPDGERPVQVVVTMAEPAIDKAKLWTAIRTEIKRALRTEVGAVRSEIEDAVVEAIDDRLTQVEGRSS